MIVTSRYRTNEYRRWREAYRARTDVKARERRNTAARQRRYRADPRLRKRIMARSKVRGLIARGLLRRGPCLRCGDRRTETHHLDYRRPLDVVWLCHRCHCLVHGKSEKARR